MTEKIGNYADNEINREKFPVSVTTVWLILIIVVLVIICFIFGYSFFIETLVLKNKELTLWFIFMLFAATITCIFGAVTSHFSQKSEENRERKMVHEIKNFLNEKTDEITSNVNVALKRSDLFSGDQEEILDKLMNRCLETMEKIERIRILAQDSSSFSKFFMKYSKNTPFICHNLEVLIHSQDKNMIKSIIDEWLCLLYTKSNDIKNLRIRRKNELKQRAFFGIIIKFQQGHHSIGMIGFYEPQEENDGNSLIPFNKRYGVLSEENSILEVIDEYFDHYFDSAEKLKDECNDPVVLV